MEEEEEIKELLRDLNSAQFLMLKLSSIAIKKNKVKQAKEFDLYAISIYKAVELLKENYL